MRTNLPIASALVILAVSSPVAAQERPRPAPAALPGTVTLPLAEYDRLVERANRPDDRPKPAPVPAVVSRADIRARVDGASVRGTIRLDGEVFKTGGVMVPLVEGATLFDARSDGRALPVAQHQGGYHAVLNGPSPFAVTLDWGAALGAAPGRASFALPAPNGGSVSATLDLPGDPLDVRVEPGLVTRRQTSGGRTLIDVSVPRGSRSQVSWAVRETAAPATPVERRMLADVKSLFRIGEADVQMIALVDVTMIRGESRTFELRVPSGFADASVSGSPVESTDTRSGTIVVTVREPSQRRYQFLVTAERGHEPGTFKLDAPLLAVADAQRETGEVAVEGAGTLEVGASGDNGLRRMDVREVHASLRSLAQEPLLAAFRFQRRPGETRTLSLDVKRFPDAAVLAAVAESATATTLVTTEGRRLTEMTLRLRNRAQPFVKVTLPDGATMLSVEVAGEAARPVQGADGMRIPLLRPGFRPQGPYSVSFVYLHAGTPFEKRGEARMALASIDLPVSMLEWELFVPVHYSLKPNGGNVIPAAMLSALAETVTVQADAPLVDSRSSARETLVQPGTPAASPRAPGEPEPAAAQQQASQNVLNLQRRIAGVLPVRVDVPRTGTSHRFVRPLVLGEVTEVRFKYKRR